MTKRNPTPLHFALASQGGSVPDWVELMPVGPHILARDGRAWTFEPTTILAAFEANNGPLVIDYEHGQDHLASQGQVAPAAGWIDRLEARQGAIWGHVEWTEKAAEMIRAKEYRFISPSMRQTAEGLITRLAGAALVNRPALEMTALCQLENLETKEPNMSFKAVAKALGLADTANEEAILVAIRETNGGIAALCGELGLEGSATLAGASAALRAMKEQHATALASEKNTLATEVTRLTTSLAAIKDERQAEKIEKALDDAQAAGKITPASRADYLALCQQEGGLERFQSLAKNLVAIADPSGLGGTDATTDDLAAENPVALAARARKYQDEQEALGNRISTAAAVAHVKDSK